MELPEWLDRQHLTSDQFQCEHQDPSPTELRSQQRRTANGIVVFQWN